MLKTIGLFFSWIFVILFAIVVLLICPFKGGMKFYSSTMEKLVKRLQDFKRNQEFKKILKQHG